MPTHFPLRRWFSGRTQCLRPLTPSMRRLTILLGVLAGAQLLFLFWLNLTQLRYHLGYDASCDYLRAAEMYRQGKLFPDHWRDTTTSHLDSPVPLAALDGWFALLVALPLTEDVTVFSQDGILYLFGAAIALVLLGALGIGCCRLIRLIRFRADGGKAGAPRLPTQPIPPTRIRTGLMDAISSTAASLPSPVVFTCTVTDEYNLMMRNMRCYDLSHVYKPIRSGEEDSLTLNERYRDEADAQGIAWNDNFDHWGDCICYDNADEYAGPITLLAEPACFEALPDSLRSEFTFYAALNDDLAVYTCNENLLGL